VVGRVSVTPSPLVRAAYNKAQRLAERRAMMQAWADHIDALKAGGRIIPIHREAGGRQMPCLTCVNLDLV
jgi:hypothetical protein